MTARIQFNPTRDREVLRAMINLGVTTQRLGMDPTVHHLIKIRVSQINGCGYCIDMHTKDARAAGETEQRLYMLSAWRETSIYSAKERAALQWAEEVTRLDNQHVPDESFHEVKRHFSEQELVVLTLAVIEINGWNRFAISFQYPAGDYQAGSVRTLREAIMAQ